MLNLKKGLALVLAAATAFTFAPVANLGNAVQAEAAETATGTVEPEKVFTSVGAGHELEAGTYKIVAGDDDKALKVTKDNGTDVASFTDKAGATYASVADTAITTKDAKYFSLTAKTAVSFTFTDQKTGLNGTHTYYVYKVKQSDGVFVNDLQFTFNITLKNSTNGYDIANAAYVAPKDLSGKDLPVEIAYKTSTAVQTATLKVPEGSDNIDSYKIESSDPSVISVNDTTPSASSYTSLTYVLTAKNIGDATIKITVKHGNTVKATKEFKYTVPASDSNIASVTLDGTHNYFTGYAETPAVTGAKPFSQIDLDTLITKSAKLNVVAAGALSFASTNPTVATVSSDGTITVVAKGITNINIYAGATSVAKAENITIPVVVSSVAKDKVTFKNGDVKVNDSDKKVDLDLSTSTAANAVKSVKLDTTSAAGSAVTLTLADANKAEVRGNSNDIATLSADGTVTAGSKAGVVYVHATTKAVGNIAGADDYAKIEVNSKPAAVLSVSDVTLDLNANKKADIEATSNLTNPAYQYSIVKSGDDENDNIALLLGKTITAISYGKATIQVAVPETTTTRRTVAQAKLNIVQDAKKTASDLKVASSALTVKVGETASAGASTTASGAAITYSSDNEKVATVAADGTITAVAPGTAVITVKAAETKTVNAGFATVTVTVPQNPAKVAGLKVANKKGAKVSVSWTSQGGSISYRVYKKVGNGKWVAKNVTSNKATLSVKKGAKVQVKVKAFVKDSTGKTTWGPKATKVTKTTDKK
ncbi:MAG: Ig-like domain-containing protein [Lachnospiraceae bacterium]|nr:Ig-like domain-containing protein [Lachnospiraceae bacterium]